ncbi:MAG: hypothetical protein AB1480_00045 [Nitrospirota bacterium]
MPLLLIIFFYDILFLGKTLSTASFLPGTTIEGPYEFSGYKTEIPFSFDIGGNAWVNEPNPYIIKRILNEGTVPIWNPYEGIGIPFVGNLNNEIFNPLKLFLNLFPHPFFQDIFFLLRLFVMGIFTHLFLREMKLSNTACLLGSSFFMLSGYSIWWINLHPLSTIMYLPAVFYFYERWGNKKGLESPFFMSLFLCFAFVSGKIPDVIMGLALLFLHALWKGMVMPPLTPPLKLRRGGGSYEGEDKFIALGKRGLSRGVIFAMFREGGKVVIGTISGALMASIALLPFIELYLHASPLAKAIRTGASSHAVPFISSVSLFQPMFLGLKNYFYTSWLKWEPNIIMPHASIIILLLSIYALLNRKTLLKIFPFFLFSFFVLSVVYGILPSYAISKLPVLRSIEFLKYNAMVYFSFSVISACAFDSLLSKETQKKKFYLSTVAVSLIILCYFYFLYIKCPSQMKSYLAMVLFFSVSGLIIAGLTFYFSKKGKTFGIVLFSLLLIELFLYMPKGHPDRSDPYKEPPYLRMIKNKEPYRIIGSGNSVPPLVSNAVGLYDIRSISVLLPGDYYTFFENLVSFSVPQTNNPNPIFSATSPFIDLTGVKYILSHEPLKNWKLEDEIQSHITSLRWVRLFDSMFSHTIKGGATYGFFTSGDERRFSIFFPPRFAFETKLRITEPFIFAGFTMKDAPEGTSSTIRIKTDNGIADFAIKAGEGWKDQWLDVSRYLGKVINITIESDGGGEGRIALGDFGPSPGIEKERILYDKLLELHQKELDSLKYMWIFEGLHLYENTNVMSRAFVLHKAEAVNDLGKVIKKLQEGIDFRKVGIISDITHDMSSRMPELFLGETLMSQRFSKEHENYHPPLISPVKGGKHTPPPLSRGELPSPTRGEDKGEGDIVIIKEYAPDKIALEVESNGGILVISDLYFPGWKVMVNGREEEVIEVFGLLRGVIIEGGKSDVLFYYRPMSLYVGMVVSMTTFIAWILFLYFKGRRKHFKNE